MLKKVLLSTDVALVCFQHALSTEKEEIMGLLIGEVSRHAWVYFLLYFILSLPSMINYS